MLTANTTSGFTVAPSHNFWGPQTNGCVNCNSGGNSAFTFQGSDFTIGSGTTNQTLNALTSNGAAVATNNFAIGAFSINPESAVAQTNTGNNSQTKVGNTTVIFSNVSSSGTTSVTAIDPNTVAAAPSGYSFCADCPAYDITTTATYSPPVTVCIRAPNVLDVSQLKLLHFETTQWVDRTTNVNAGTKTVCGDVTSLSPFAVAQGQTPTAATGMVTGRITDPSGNPIAGVVVNLSGSQNRKTITDVRGRYHFVEVETSGFYTITPARANYYFLPGNRSFSSLANTADVSFTAMPEAIITVNPLDTTEYFVRQQYLDFLKREPDEGGFDYWSDQINRCNGDAKCIAARRIDVAAAFFVEREFQETSSFLFGLYTGVLARTPRFGEFEAARSRVVGGTDLEVAKANFVQEFVTRPEFAARYPQSLTGEQFVEALLQTLQQRAGVDLSSLRDTLTNAYGSAGRAAAVRAAVEASLFVEAEFNRAFVYMEYFGYLRRDPERAGYEFWLNVLNHREPGNYRGMVCSFITSTEYQKRFSSVITHSNSECGQ
jgi:hypothetical protein